MSYINKETLIKNVCHQYQGVMNTFLAKPNDFVQMIEDAPGVELPKKCGFWKKGNIILSIFGLAVCSECGIVNERTYYCPNCGAMMDVERKVTKNEKS